MSENDSNIRAVERAIQILRCFKQEKLELTLTEIATETDLPRSTTSRILSTLEKHRFLARNEDNQKYYLGAEMARLGVLCYSNLDYRKIALPFMYELRDLYNESVSLYIAEGGQRVCIERVESTHSLRRVINIGDQLPLTLGASGRLLLAYMEKERIETIVGKDPSVRLEDLEKLKRAGYTISKGERETGITSIAAPIFSWQKQVVAALTISGPSERFKEEEIPARVQMVQHYAKLISHALGCYQ
ncbi:MAG: IclR family transcriptional regulator [Peptococcaceae bacterium]